jgi:pimeloyl-ACP methyl ester carboxylesterase
MRPAIRYAKSGDLCIAYQVMGEASRDVLLAPGFISHLEWVWENARSASFLERLASFSRLLLLDKRGTGLSDPVPTAPTLEERIDDLRAVMDCVGSERAVVLGVSEGGAMAALFAATYPERTSGLILYGAFAKLPRTPDYPEGVDPTRLQLILDDVVERWGDGANLVYWGPGGTEDPAFQDWWGRFQQLGASPAMARRLFESYPKIDVRNVLPAIRVPTLVLHRRDDRQVPVRMGRFLAEHIPGAKYVELEGDDHLFFLGDTDALLDEIEEFVAGVRRGPDPDRVLATVLFIDIVGSTSLAAEMGDAKWKELLQSYYATARRQLERFRGTEIKTIGDGMLATFDGPTRGTRCALAIRDGVRALGLDIRAGLHTGEVESMGEDVGGIAVHIAARIIGQAHKGEILTSSTVRDLAVGSGIEFDDRGAHPLKGVPHEWHLYAISA